MKTLCCALFLVLVLAGSDVDAAIGDHLMSKAIPVGFGEVGGLALDGADNFAVHGTFFGSIDLGGGTLTSVNFFDGDQFLARFDADGNHLWSVQYTPIGPGIGNERLAGDAAGNLYITGTLFNGASINYGGGSLVGPGLYVAKFNSSGVHQWSAVYGGGTPRSITSNNFHVTLTGYTSTGLDFGGGSIGTAGGNDVFVAHLTNTGAHAWSAGFGDANDQGGMGVSVDPSGNVIVVGSMFGTVDFGGGGLAANLLDLFMARFSPTGAHQWSRVFDGTFTPGGGILVNTAITAGPSGAIAITGEMRNSVDFGGGTLTSNGFSDIYVARFDSAGVHQWSAQYGTTTGTDRGQSVAIDQSGNVLITGSMYDDTDLGGGVVSFVGDPLNFETNIFAALYSANGAHIFSKAWGPHASLPGCQFDSGNQLVLHGFGGSSIDLGGGALTPADYFVAKLEGTSGPPTDVNVVPIPASDHLRAYPNPFNPVTTIDYVVDTAGVVSLSVHDVHGRLVSEIFLDRWHVAGRYTASFEAAASGLYLAQLRVGSSLHQVKLVAIK